MKMFRLFSQLPQSGDSVFGRRMLWAEHDGLHKENSGHDQEHVTGSADIKNKSGHDPAQ